MRKHRLNVPAARGNIVSQWPLETAVYTRNARFMGLRATLVKKRHEVAENGVF